jgi:succinate dehydrogenase / fumarate reductase cytochrome b subunit
MSNNKNMFSSSLGQKLIMSLTGLFLISFLLIHLIGNLQLFTADYGYKFNVYARFMTTNPLIKTVSYLLYFSILFHAIKGILLERKNRSARKSKYAVAAGSTNSSWSSRNMGILGVIMLVFIVIHMSDFWFEYKFGEIPWTRYEVNLENGQIIHQSVTDESLQHFAHYTENGKDIFITKDLYLEVKEAFGQWWYVLLYVLSMVAIAFHLWHGFESAFQTLGINHPHYTPWIQKIGRAFSVLIPAGFALIPIVYFFTK